MVRENTKKRKNSRRNNKEMLFLGENTKSRHAQTTSLRQSATIESLNSIAFRLQRFSEPVTHNVRGFFYVIISLNAKFIRQMTDNKLKQHCKTMGSVTLPLPSTRPTPFPAPPEWTGQRCKQTGFTRCMCFRRVNTSTVMLCEVHILPPNWTEAGNDANRLETRCMYSRWVNTIMLCKVPCSRTPPHPTGINWWTVQTEWIGVVVKLND